MCSTPRSVSPNDGAVIDRRTSSASSSSAPPGDSLEPPPLTSPDVPLAEHFKIGWLLSQAPPTYAVKGMFISRIALDLDDAWADASRRLLSPPKWGRYLPFSDYPMVDQAAGIHCS